MGLTVKRAPQQKKSGKLSTYSPAPPPLLPPPLPNYSTPLQLRSGEYVFLNPKSS